MTRPFTLTLFSCCILLLFSTGCPQPPEPPLTLEITAPRDGASVGQTFFVQWASRWDGEFAVMLDGHQVAMVTGSPVELREVPTGQRTVAIYAARAGQLYSLTDQITVTVRDRPAPVTALVEWIRELLRQRLPRERAAEAAVVADVFADAAERIDRLRDPLNYDGPFRPQQWIDQLTRETQERLGASWSTWQPIVGEIYAELNRRGQLPDDDPLRIGGSIYDVGLVAEQVATAARMHATPAPTQHFRTRPTSVLVTHRLPASMRPPATPDENCLWRYAGVAPPDRDSDGLLRSVPELTPDQLAIAYERGFIGAHIDAAEQPAWSRELGKEGERRFLAESPEGLLSDSSFPAEFSGEGQGQRAVWWNYAMRFCGDPTRIYEIQQITGNCVEASNGDVTFTHMLGVSVFLLGEAYDWAGAGSSVFYAWRGHRGSGMNLGTAAAAHQRHGHAIRRDYGSVDLRDSRTDQTVGMNHWRDPARSLAELWAATREKPIGRVARFNGGASEAMDVLYVGGALHTGSNYTAARNGDPVSSRARIGAHAQTCVGYDDTDEFRQWYAGQTGKRLTEPVFVFVQTWGNLQYVQRNWPEHLWGRMPQGAFVLAWSDARHLIQGTTYAYWPEGLHGLPPRQLLWRVATATGATAEREPIEQQHWALAP